MFVFSLVDASNRLMFMAENFGRKKSYQGFKFAIYLSSLLMICLYQITPLLFADDTRLYQITHLLFADDTLVSNHSFALC